MVSITRRYKMYDVSTDLKLNPLVGYDKRYIITIAENKVLYKFSIYDLLYVIQTNLTYTYALFVDPKFPRNPYTNLPFSIHNLYNIFYFAKKLDFFYVKRMIQQKIIFIKIQLKI